MSLLRLARSHRAPLLLLLTLGCATYEQTPMSGGDQEPIDGDSGSAGGGSRAAEGGARPSGGRTTTEGGGGAEKGGSPAAGAATGGAGKGGSPANPGGNASGGMPSAGAPGGGGAGAPGIHFQAWTFDDGTSGWEIRDQSPELSAKLSASNGALELLNVPFTAVKQYVDVAYTFSAPANLQGRTLHVTLERTAGAFVGVQVYAYGGAWGSPSFESLGSGGEVMLAVALNDLTAKGVDTIKVARIGLKIGTGSNASGTFGTSSIRVAEVTID